MNCTGDIEFCVMCEAPDTKLESDDFDFCKRCKIKEFQSYIETLNEWGKIMTGILKKHNLIEEFQAEVWKQHNEGNDKI